MQIMRSRAHNGAYVVYMGLTARVRVISCIMVNGREAAIGDLYIAGCFHRCTAIYPARHVTR